MSASGHPKETIHGPRRTHDPGPDHVAPPVARRVLDAVHAEPRVQGRSADGGSRRRRVAVERPRRQDHRRVVGPVLRIRGTRPQGDRRGRRQAAPRARLLRAVPARTSETVRARHTRGRADPGRSEPRLFRELGIRIRRHRDEGRARLSSGAGPERTQRLRVARARLPRRQFRRGRAVGPCQQPAQVRPGTAGHRAHAPHASRGEFLHQGRRRARRRARRGPRSLRESLWRREHRRLLRRADRRLDRLPRAAERLSRAPARDLRRARHPAGVRRGDLRLRAHRADVRRAELRRDAGHPDDGEGHHQRRAADGRRRGERAHPRHDHGRRARGRDRVLPRLHVLRTSGRVRGGACDARHLQERRAVRARPRALAVPARRDLLAQGHSGRRRHSRLRDVRPRSTFTRTALRAGAARRSRRSCSRTASI